MTLWSCCQCSLSNATWLFVIISEAGDGTGVLIGSLDNGTGVFIGSLDNGEDVLIGSVDNGTGLTTDS